MLDQNLIDKNIPFIIRDGTRFFELKVLKEKTKDLFIDGSKVVEIDSKKYIQSKYIRPQTDFDKTMSRLFKKD